MIDGPFICVSGPKAAGKTTLLERLLAVTPELVTVARCERDKRLRRAQEPLYDNDAELDRYRAVGASSAVRYRFPPGLGDGVFFESDFMNDYSDGMIVEGTPPSGFSPDLRVFVAPPLPGGSSLLCKVAGRLPEPQNKLLALLESRLGRRGMGTLLGDIVGAVMRQTTASLNRTGLLDDVASPRGTSRQSDERWAIAEAYGGLEAAQVVVINVRSDAERAQAQAMVPEIKRLRQDKEVFDDVIGWAGRRTPITVAVADLSDPKDKGLKRTLTRIRRVFKSESWEES
jgi:hypothetical protein